jgi:hypothetical protein
MQFVVGLYLVLTQVCCQNYGDVDDTWMWIFEGPMAELLLRRKEAFVQGVQGDKETHRSATATS